MGHGGVAVLNRGELTRTLERLSDLLGLDRGCAALPPNRARAEDDQENHDDNAQHGELALHGDLLLGFLYGMTRLFGRHAFSPLRITLYPNFTGISPGNQFRFDEIHKVFRIRPRV